MGHPLEKPFFVGLLFLLMAATIPATRKEDLERAAELAVERAAERAAERAVEKALEAGNTTSTTITVKESYSNARKTAEEQAAPGSESTRKNNKETSFFETKDTDDPLDYEPASNETEYTDYNESRGYNDEESSGYGDYDDSRGYSDYNNSRGYSDYNDSRGYSDYNDSRGYSDYNDSRGFSDFNDSKNFGDYKDSRGFGDFSESKKYKEYNAPRGFGDYNFGGRDFNDSKSFREPRGYNQSKSYNDVGGRNYTDSKDNRDSKNNSRGYKDSKSLNDYGDSKGYEVEEDYSSFLNDTDYKKLNSSKSSIDPEIILSLGDFDWSSNDSDLLHGFGSKLSGVGRKLVDSALSEDISFYPTKTDFSKKRNSKKEYEEDDVDKDDSWKSYSDWEKDFKSIGDESFSKVDETFLKGYEPFTKDFWDGGDEDSPLKSSRPFWTDEEDLSPIETKKEDKKGHGSKINLQEKGGTSSSTDKSFKKPSSKDYDFYTLTKSWQPDDKDSRPSYESYSRRSSRDETSGSIIPPYHKRLSRDNAQKKGTTSSPKRTTTSTVRPSERITERSFREYSNRSKATSSERYSDGSEEEQKEGSYERSNGKSNKQSKERFRDESIEDTKEESYERFREESEERSKETSREQFSDESREEYEGRSYGRSKEVSNNRPEEKYKERFPDEPRREYTEDSYKSHKDRSTEKWIRLPDQSREYKKNSYESYKDGSTEETKVRLPDRSREYKENSYERYKDRSTEKSKVRLPDRSSEYKENSYRRYKEGPTERRLESTIERRNIKYVSNKKEENASEDVKTIPHKLGTLSFNVYNQSPVDVKESRQPDTIYKVPEKVPVQVPVNLLIPVNLPSPVQLQENSQKVKENQENLRGIYRGNLQGSSHAQFLQNLYDSLNIPTAYPLIPRTILTVPKPTSKEVVDHYPHELPKLHLGQKRLPLRKHKQLDVDDRLSMLIKMGVPGPFPIENDRLQLEKPNSVPVKIVENPYTIHLDKSIPLALKERIPFIIHVPLKPKEIDGWSEARYSKKYENVPVESQTWIKRISWV